MANSHSTPRHPTFQDMTGQRFGSWTVVRYLGQKYGAHAEWLCQCDCGTERPVLRQGLRTGLSRSCGCQIKRRIKHGGTKGNTKSPTYSTWHAMKSRCHNPNSSKYASYGGRGISVCTRWRESFAHFLEDMGERPFGYTLERVDNNGNYGPENCRWATRKEQQRNRRINRVLSLNGKSQCLKAWSDELGIGYSTLCGRLRRGWSDAKTLSTPRLSQGTKNCGIV